MDARARFAELTADCHCQVDLDALVSRYNGLGNLYRTEFPGVDKMEFRYEWQRVRLLFRGRMTSTLR